jgi:hypothetical protein
MNKLGEREARCCLEVLSVRATIPRVHISPTMRLGAAEGEEAKVLRRSALEYSSRGIGAVSQPVAPQASPIAR